MAKKIFVLGSLVAFGVLSGGCAASTRTADQYRDDTAKVFAARDNDLKACVAEARKADPNAAGTVTVGFLWAYTSGNRHEDGSRVADDVKVVDAQTTAPPALRDCALNVVKSSNLTPDGKGYGRATWTFRFDAPGAAPAADAPKS